MQFSNKNYIHQKINAIIINNIFNENNKIVLQIKIKTLKKNCQIL